MVNDGALDNHCAKSKCDKADALYHSAERRNKQRTTDDEQINYNKHRTDGEAEILIEDCGDNIRSAATTTRIKHDGNGRTANDATDQESHEFFVTKNAIEFASRGVGSKGLPKAKKESKDGSRIYCFRKELPTKEPQSGD